MFRAENDILKLISSRNESGRFFSRFLTHFWSFLVILGHKCHILWVRNLGARGTPPPNFNMFRLRDPRSTQAPRWGRLRPAVQRRGKELRKWHLPFAPGLLNVPRRSHPGQRKQRKPNAAQFRGGREVDRPRGMVFSSNPRPMGGLWMFQLRKP